MRWGELVGLRVRHVDFLRRSVLVQDVVIEVSTKDSPTGERFVTKPYPKNDQTRRLRITSELVEAIARHSRTSTCATTICCSQPTAAPAADPSPAKTSASGSGCRRSGAPASASRCASTTSATPTHHGCSPAAPTSKSSWTAWDTPTWPPPNATYTHCLTPTTEPSTPSSAPAHHDGIFRRASTATPTRAAPAERVISMRNSSPKSRERRTSMSNDRSYPPAPERAITDRAIPNCRPSADCDSP
jgi:hypothetical protein